MWWFSFICFCLYSWHSNNGNFSIGAIMNVLSLFDGMSGGQLALQKAGLKVDKYYSCEIDEYAQSVTRYNFPNTIFLGDVTKVDFSKLENIDLVCFGSPCQDVSFSGKGAGLEGSRSRLFYKAVEAIKICNPEYFFMENVKMKQEYQDIISDLLGVQPTFINSKDFSAQSRQRLYWTNIPIMPWQPCDTKLNDILEDGQNYNPASIVTRRIDKDGKREGFRVRVRGSGARAKPSLQDSNGYTARMYDNSLPLKHATHVRLYLDAPKSEGEGYIGSGWIGQDWRSQLA